MTKVAMALSSSIILAAISLPGSALARDETIIGPEGSVSIDAFRPADYVNDSVIEYAYWDYMLQNFVVPMGLPTREGSPRVDPPLLTRRLYGHESRMRLEGNRIGFSFMTDEVLDDLTAYRAELEQLAETIDITQLSRNEQLAFWLNLHNVAVIHALAHAYPLAEPDEGEFGSNSAPLHDAKLVTVRGVKLSPRDIREKIVYPNWRNPKVIYGFWHGKIGGPSIPRRAYNGDNVDFELTRNAREFVNSLRGVEAFGKYLRVSKIYEEAASYYFNDFSALRAHLTEYARDEVKDLIAKKPLTKYNQFESDIADLARGERMPGVFATATGSGPVKVNAAIMRLLVERQQKIEKLEKRGLRTGTVTFSNIKLPGDEDDEVE